MNSNVKKDKKKAWDPKDATMSFIDHLDELRKRLIRFFIVLIVCVLATYFFRADILNLVKKPVDLPLDKYTSSGSPTHTRQASGLDLATYRCNCQRIEPAAATPVPPVDEEIESNRLDKADVSSDVLITEPEKNMGDVITSTIDDFIMYFQSLLGKTPTPLFGEVETTKMEPSGDSPIVETGDQIKLECQCEVKAPEAPQGASMVYIGLPELFFTQMKVAIFAGLFLSLPYLMIELWGFVGPALYSGEKRMFWVFAVGSYFFFIGGALFGYFVVFPFAFDFFLSLTQMGEIMPSLSIGAYLSFAIKLLIAFGAIFELPLVVFILARLGIVTPGMMIKQARIAIFAIFIIAAFLTPPDPFTMVLMAGPLILLYILSIGICFVGFNKKKAALRAQGFDEDEGDTEAASNE